jgi:hypothetical protein
MPQKTSEDARLKITRANSWNSSSEEGIHTDQNTAKCSNNQLRKGKKKKNLMLTIIDDSNAPLAPSICTQRMMGFQGPFLVTATTYDKKSGSLNRGLATTTVTANTEVVELDDQQYHLWTLAN